MTTTATRIPLSIPVVDGRAAVPSTPNLTEDDQDRVIPTIRRVLERP